MQGLRIEEKASFTVEASLVVSSVLVILFFVLQMTFFLTDTVRAEAILAEGSLRIDAGMESDGSWMKGTGGFFQFSSSAFAAQTDSSKITVSSAQTSASLLPGRKAVETLQREKTRFQPVSFVRTVRLRVLGWSGEG